MMDNHTSIKYFNILAFSSKTEKQPLLSITFMIIYLIGVLANTSLILVSVLDTQLQTPMYFFLRNLSFVDIIFTTITLPKLINILWMGINTISFIQCFIQVFFFVFMASTDDILLSCMAYDRYIAICYPLHYHILMNWKKAVSLLGGTWVIGCANGLITALFVSNLSFCESRMIQNFYCDIKALSKIACTPNGLQIFIYLETLSLGLGPFLVSLTSYIKIIGVVLQIQSPEGKRKAFSTCTSHLTVLTIFYGSILLQYTMPPLEKVHFLDKIFTVLYTALTPMLNPIIYSLRNKEVKSAIMRILR
ncbi:olfactory receptor 1G1-like [Bufo gargarizans]|uniref:olfactory receptor 1G1-like n=1 Tax=Bufo gargarizans TaxID=30331 RepID=UPI001CF5221B|nr:olfactory receptor 1G1-like [Bufo gargarizans]